MMPSGQYTLPLCLLLVAVSGLAAQSVDAPAQTQRDSALVLVNPRTTRWKLGVVIQSHGTITGIVATLPVPAPWPEQEVKILDQHQTSQVRSVRIRPLAEGVHLMTVTIPRMAPGQEASAEVVMEIIKHDIAEPATTESLRSPGAAVQRHDEVLETQPLHRQRGSGHRGGCQRRGSGPEQRLGAGRSDL